MGLSTIFGPKIYFDAIVALGAVPVTSNLQAENAYLLLEKQWVDLVTALVAPPPPPAP